MNARVSPALWPRLARRAAKQWLPRSLYGRSVLIIILPILIMQAAVGWAFFEAHEGAVSRQLSESLAGDVAWLVGRTQAARDPAELQRVFAEAERDQSLSAAFQPGRALPGPRRPGLLPTFDTPLREAVDDKLDEAFWIDTARYPGFVDIRVAVRGGVLRILAPRERAFSTRGFVFLLWLTGATLLLTAVAVGFIRNQVRAIERLAAAADAFGRGAEAPAFKPHGAREVRQAAEAFLAMKARIGRHIEQRTTLLASVSHDLRTPLTRLKLELALADPSPQAERMAGDLREMEHMVEEYLDFARGQGSEAPEAVDLAVLLREVGDDAARMGAEVSVRSEAPLHGRLRPRALRRALTNLVMNAAAHAERVALAARRSPFGGLEIEVDDDGPGIPPDRYEEAFRPFSRLDESRNQNTKGVGLGLAIARDVARSHGGELALSQSPLGGLRATLRLPG
ncbi:MAG: ATP-binding protein [Caulobacteraceae bacterium]|nr:ATP-binding protein [Caulobacter sp.]